MSTTHLSTPDAVMSRLADIENHLAEIQNEVEEAAFDWYRAKRDREHERAALFIASEGTVAERTARADRETAHIGKESEARYEALRAVIKVLEARASIGQSLLKAQGRA